MEEICLLIKVVVYKNVLNWFNSGYWVDIAEIIYVVTFVVIYSKR